MIKTEQKINAISAKLTRGSRGTSDQVTVTYLNTTERLGFGISQGVTVEGVDITDVTKVQIIKIGEIGIVDGTNTITVHTLKRRAKNDLDMSSIGVMTTMRQRTQ